MVKNLINKFSIKRTIYFEHYVRQIRQLRQINIISPRRIFSNVRKGERYMVKILKDIFSIKKKLFILNTTSNVIVKQMSTLSPNQAYI